MQNISEDLITTERIVAEYYRGLKHVISNLTGEPQPPCYFCMDHQIWSCSVSGQECDTFKRYYSNYEL